MYTTLQQYIRARWRNLSHESRRTMGLDKPERYLSFASPMERYTMTRTLLLASIAALALATPAQAQQARPYVDKVDGINMLQPPAQFDKPYAGKLYFITFTDSAALWKICEGASHVSCSIKYPDHCILIVMKDLAKNDLVIKHELAHCNGWDQKHTGAIPWPRVPSDKLQRELNELQQIEWKAKGYKTSERSLP